ncbi:MAG: tdcB [Rickettsiaceae bacterium]|jgi:threonine dehydratase|nr:tdcB [Rickettsiaceae bacterium]
MPVLIQDSKHVKEAYARILHFLHKTPLIQSEVLNQMLGHDIYFKAESLQKTGAFKVRGVLNHLLTLKEEGKLPSKVVAYSTGNHGIGLAWAARKIGIKSRIYLPKNTSPVKQKAVEYYGGEVIYTETRQEAEDLSRADQNQGYYYLHPSDSDSTIAGAGTMCYEALNQMEVKPDAIFASCGGGGLLSGTYLAKEALSPESLLFGTEPSIANDAYLSLQRGSIYRFDSSPQTVADGLRTLGVSERAFAYLKKLDGFSLVEEYDIYYWTAWLIHLLKIATEPSCAMNMKAVVDWLRAQESRKTVLVMISGGNIDPSLYRELWKEDYLLTPPKL